MSDPYKVTVIHKAGSKSSSSGSGGDAKPRATYQSNIPAAVRRAEQEGDIVKVLTVPPEISRAIREAREGRGPDGPTGKVRTMDEFARDAKISKQIVHEWESGKAIYNGEMLVKFEKALNVKLPRPKKAGK